MKFVATAVMTAALAVFIAAPAFAQDRASEDEARAMAEAAAALLIESGPEVAYPAFDDDPAWIDRDLYVFVIRDDGVAVSRGVQHELIGQDISGFTDVNGFLFVQAFLAVEDEDWVDYVWTDPITQTEVAKRSYIVRVGDVIVGVGAYSD